MWLKASETTRKLDCGLRTLFQTLFGVARGRDRLSIFTGQFEMTGSGVVEMTFQLDESFFFPSFLNVLKLGLGIVWI